MKLTPHTLCRTNQKTIPVVTKTQSLDKLKPEPEPKAKPPTAAQLKKAAFDALSPAEQEAQTRAERIAKYRAKIAELARRKRDTRYYEPDDVEKLARYIGWDNVGDPEQEARNKLEKDERACKRYERLLRQELGEEPPNKKAQKGKWGKKRPWQKHGKGHSGASARR